MTRPGAVVAEAAAVAWSQRLTSLLIAIFVAVMCSSVLLTAGRTAAAREDVLASFDSAGTRTIVVRADPGADVLSSALDRIDEVDGIELTVGFAAAHDAYNAALPRRAASIPVREVYGSPLTLRSLGVPDDSATASPIFLSMTAASQAGLAQPAGSLLDDSSGRSYNVAGYLTRPEALAFLEPLAISPSSDATEPLTVLLVVVRDARQVEAIADAIVPLLAAEDPTLVTVQTSKAVADLREVVDGRLDDFGSELVLVIFAVTAALVAALLSGLVLLRRKDFGRRRALGATRGLLVALLMSQVAMVSVVGIAVGSGAAAVVLAVEASGLPPVDYFVSVALCALGVGLVAGLVPALLAATRDPLHELRVP